MKFLFTLGIFLMLPKFAMAERSYTLLGSFNFDSTPITHTCQQASSKAGYNYYCNFATEPLLAQTITGLNRLDMVKAQLKYYDKKVVGFGPTYMAHELLSVPLFAWKSLFTVRKVKSYSAFFIDTLPSIGPIANAATIALVEGFVRSAFAPVIEMNGFQDVDVQEAYQQALLQIGNGSSTTNTAVLLEGIHNTFGMAKSAMLFDKQERSSHYSCGRFEPSTGKDSLLHLNLQTGLWKAGRYDKSTSSFAGGKTTPIGYWTPSSIVPWKDFMQITLGETLSVMARDTTTGNWWAASVLSNGSLKNRWMGTWAVNVPWTNIFVGNFFGDSRQDFIGMIPTSGYGQTNGQVYGAVATDGPENTTSFQNILASANAPDANTDEKQYFPADLYGEGRKGVIRISGGYDAKSYQFWYLRPNAQGNGFSQIYLTTRFAPNSGTIYDNEMANFVVVKDAQGKDSLVWRETNPGSLFQLKIENGLPAIASIATNIPGPVGLTDVTAVELNGDGKQDIIARNIRTGEWVGFYSSPNSSNYSYTSIGIKWDTAKNLHFIGACSLDGQNQYVLSRTGKGRCFAANLTQKTPNVDIGECE